MASVVLALTLVLVACAPSPASAWTVADSSGLTVVIDGITANYASEAWKDVAPLGETSLPLPGTVPGAQVYRNPYATTIHSAPIGPNFWGYFVEFNVSLADGAGNRITPGVGTSYEIEAHVQTVAGKIPALLAKTGPASFTIRIDADGEVGQEFPSLVPGANHLVVDVYEKAADPTQTRQKVGDASLPFQATSVLHDVPFALFPTRHLGTYSDVGGGNTTLLHPEQLRANEPLGARFQFGEANASAAITLVSNRDARVLAEGRTDATGALNVTFEPREILGDAPNGLLLLAAHLRGGVGLTGPVGSTVIALPVSPYEVTISGMRYEERGAAGTGFAPASSVKITASDPAASGIAGAKRGTLLVQQGLEVLMTAEFVPDESGAPSLKAARIPAQTIRDEELSRYGLLALFTDEQNRFYAMATAHRGVGVAAEVPHLRPFEEGIVRLVVRNLNDNFDNTTDSGLAMPVHVRVTGLPGGSTFEKTVTVDEGSVAFIDVPFRADASSLHSLTVNATSGELRVDRAVNVLVSAAAKPDEGFWAQVVPGPGIGLLAAIGVGLALLVRRRC